MLKLLPTTRIGVVAAAVLAFAIPLLASTPASAYWYGYGPGWHRGYWGGPRVVVRPPPVIVAAPPAPYYARRPVWTRPHWNGPYWVPGHWG